MFSWLKLKPGCLNLAVASTLLLLLVVTGSAHARREEIPWQVWRWSQEDPRPVRMVPSQNSACFLTFVRGKFQGSAEWVGVRNKNGFWFLEGGSNQMGVRAEAFCTVGSPENPVQILGSFDWHQDKGSSTRMVPTGESACFLTEVSGKFQGSGEQVQITEEFGYWWLIGKSDQKSVRAKAICINVKGVSGEYRWHQNQGSETKMENSDCFLTMMSGKFMGGGESIAIIPVYSEPSRYVILTGSSGQKSVQAGARCIRY